MSKRESQTTKVRVKLAVSPTGKWFCYGYSGCEDEDAEGVIYDMATDEPTLSWKFLTAEIELPQPQEVQANVEAI